MISPDFVGVEVVDHLRLVADVPRAVDAVLHVGPAVVHVDEVDAGETGFADHAVGELERVLRAVAVLGLDAFALQALCDFLALYHSCKWPLCGRFL